VYNLKAVLRDLTNCHNNCILKMDGDFMVNKVDFDRKITFFENPYLVREER
jgi:hypothetical protein